MAVPVNMGTQAPANQGLRFMLEQFGQKNNGHSNESWMRVRHDGLYGPVPISLKWPYPIGCLESHDAVDHVIGVLFCLTDPFH